MRYTEGDAVVVQGTGGTNTFSGTVDTSRLNAGRYNVVVSSTDETLQAEADTGIEIITPPPAPGNRISLNLTIPRLPPLAVNESMPPVLLDGAWKLVPPGTGTKNSDLPYGSIVYCSGDGICRAFDSSGNQFLAVYNSNEAYQMEVPNGAFIHTPETGNVSSVKLDNTLILTRIDDSSGMG